MKKKKYKKVWINLKKKIKVMGSSMGGLISFYGGLKYANIYSKVGALSPSFWFNDPQIYDYAKKYTK